MPLILSGRAARDEFKKKLIEQVRTRTEKRGGSLMVLAIIQVGDRPDSAAYINAKKRFGAEIGVEVRHVHFKEDASREELVEEIRKLNLEKGIVGIIVQLPVPKHLDERAILDSIDPAKDVDAITSANVKKWSGADGDDDVLWPATARGIGELLGFYKISLKGKNVCVIGRSPLVGTPIAALCRAKGAIVTVCHSKTADLAKETRVADIVISAVGTVGLVAAGHVRPGQIIVDVGLSRIGDRLVGDVDFEDVSAVVGESGAITPVPGGVGPMTVLALFENVADCATM